MASIKKGEYVRSYRDDINHTIVHIFKYRDHEYEVIDSGWKGGQQPIYAQHKAEQDHIDELIKKEHKWATNKKENSQVGLDLFFNYIDD